MITYLTTRLSHHRRWAFAIPIAVFIASLPFAVHGQSGTSSEPVRRPSSGQAPLALDGYCPVCILKMKKWVKGSPQFASQFDGKVYLFPGAEPKQAFDANPISLAPVLGGDCVVAWKKMGKRVPGSVRFAAIQNGRLYLMSSEQAKQEFLEHYDQYIDADVVMGGKCPVCRIEMGKDVMGKPEFAAVHKGFQYRFPSAEQRDLFLANPSKYALKPSSRNAGGSGSGSGQR